MRELIGGRESSRVEPARGCPLVGGQCRIADEIRTLGREAGIAERVCLRHRDRHADCMVMKLATVQSFTSAPTTPARCLARPWPAGRSQTTEAVK